MKKMKKMKIITLLFLSISLVGYSQSSSTNVSDNNTIGIGGISGNSNGSGNGQYGSAMRFVNPPRTVDGSIFLFDDWKNYPVVVKSKDNITGVRNFSTNALIEGREIQTAKIDKVKINMNLPKQDQPLGVRKPYLTFDPNT